MIVQYLDKNGNEHELPYELSDIPAKNYFEFKLCIRSFWADKQDGHSETGAYLKHVADACSTIVKTAHTMPIGTISDGDNGIFEGGTITLFATYSHLMAVVTRYNPSKFIPVNLEGKMYYLLGKKKIAKREIDALAGFTDDQLTVQEMTEAMQARHALSTHIEGAKSQYTDYRYISQLEHGFGLLEVAVLLRKENEKLPTSEIEFSIFQQQRAELFEKLSPETILQVQFFFQNFLTGISTISALNRMESQDRLLESSGGELPRSSTELTDLVMETQEN